MIVRYYCVFATAENPAPTGAHDTIAYCTFTVPDFWYNTLCLKPEQLLRVMRVEIEVMQLALIDLGVDPATIQWRALLSMPVDTEAEDAEG